MAAVGGSANLYNGTEYTASYPFTTGSPFWDTSGFKSGIISYEGVVYKDIPISYDLVSNEVLIKGYQQLTIKLDASKINFFLINGHLFVRLNGEANTRNLLPADIYELSYNGNIKLYVKRKKQAERSFNPADPDRIVAYNAYFVQKDSLYHQVSSKNALLKLFRDKSDAIRTFWKENNLNFRTDPEKTIIQTITYYTKTKE